jgi:hypothetical protein
VGWQLGVEWAWRWGGLGVGLSWVGVVWGRAWVQLIQLGLGSFGLRSLCLLLTLGFNGLPNTVTDQTPQGHLIFGTGNFIDTHSQLLFFYLLEK